MSRSFYRFLLSFEIVLKVRGEGRAGGWGVRGGSAIRPGWSPSSQGGQGGRWASLDGEIGEFWLRVLEICSLGLLNNP